MSQQVLEAIAARFPDAVVDTHHWRGDDTATVKREFLVEVCRFLRDDPELDFKMPIDVCGVDYLGHREPRFEVVYHLYSVTKGHRVRLKVQVPEDDCEVPSVTGVWRGVDWFEREVWDMYGVRFAGHPKLRRILLYEDFEGHPLRKDYPQRGYQPLMPMPTLPTEGG
ncbi:MAG: NADH-quinone oxidoreductase subunit C [Deltaproteobacteria bacterium]|nr:MAG: NADH-quinone oxidoreductase subunit C [Deltaproteobacteria bacterium]